MHVLTNSKYYFAIPNCSKKARDLIEELARDKYKRQLKFARMSKINKTLEAGILLRRTI